jgi:DNA gyrase/topoisomerase IV subunit B
MPSYTEKDILLLDDREHVRLRLPVYAGSTKETTYNVPLFTRDGIKVNEISFIPAVYKCIGEILDNSLDEFAQTRILKPKLTINSNSSLGMYDIADNGRGVPIGKHESGMFTPQVVFGSLRSGRNFTAGKESGVIGQNGMGSSMTNFCSSEFTVEIVRDGKIYTQSFKDGAAKVSEPEIKPFKGETGTTISFQLDSDVFDDISLPDELMYNRAHEIALMNQGVYVNYNNETIVYKRGLREYIKRQGYDFTTFHIGNSKFFVLFNATEDQEEQMFTWVNSSLLFDGGICNTQFCNSFFSKVISSLEKEAKKRRCVMSKADVRPGLIILGNLKLSDPQYDAQSKTRLVGPSLRNEIDHAIDQVWSDFSRIHQDWLEQTLERAVNRYHKTENKKAIKDHEKTLRRKVPGLVDATGKDRINCQLLITEGLSASSEITQARDSKTTGSFSLKGKINNVYGTTPAQLLKMGKITDLLASIGLIPGKTAIPSLLRFGKIVIATDADVDGSDIFTLLVNLFYQFWPELFDPEIKPVVYRLVVPNICLIKGKKRIHFSTREEYEKVKERYEGYTVKYYKGLGGMSREDWDMILSGKSDTYIPITDDGKMKETLELLFSNEVQPRKEWLQDEERY